MPKKIVVKTVVFIVMSAVFVIWVAIFDRNNMKVGTELDQTIESLQAEKEYYLKKIDADSVIIRGLKDSRYIEQYAREHYLMKRPGEEIYIIKVE